MRAVATLAITRVTGAVFMSAFEKEYKSSQLSILFSFILGLDVMVSAAKVS